MSLASLSVRRAVTMAMIFIIVAGFGLFSLSRLKLDLYPDIDFPMVVIVTQYDGAGPREIEDLVSRRIEGAVASVDGVKKVSSTSKQNVSLVSVEFNWGADLNQAEIDVRKYIDMMRSTLPDDAQDPIVFAINPSFQPVAFLAVRGPYPLVRLRQISEEKIEPLIERVPGIALADTNGGGKREIKIELDPRRLAAARLSPLQVVNALRADNVQLPAGSFEQGPWEFVIQTKGKFTSVKQIEEVVVGVREQVPVRLRDIAEVQDGLKEETRLVRNDGQYGVMLMVRKQSDANTVQAVRALKRILPDIENKVGRGVKVSVIFDQGEFIEQAIGNLGDTAYQAVLLTFLVLLFFLRKMRPSLIVAVSIPLSVLATFSVMDGIGLTLNIISMSGLALAIGMLVDNSIVVQESIFLRHEQGEPPHEAAIEGTKEVSMAITASTLTTVVVFLPILFVPGVAGQLFRDMSITVCVSLLISLAVAVTAVPLAASRLLKRRATDAAPQEGPLGRFHTWMTEGYARSLDWVLHHRKGTYAMIGVVTVVTIALAFRLPTQFFPREDHGLIFAQGKGPLGTSLEETDRTFQQVEKVINGAVPELTTMNVDMGSGEGFTALLAEGQHSGIVRLKLKGRKERTRKQQEIEEDLRQRLSKLPGFTFNISQGNMFGAAGDIVVEIYGHDLAQAHDVGLKIKDVVTGVKGTADVTFSLEAGKPEYEVLLDRSRLAALGLNTAAVSQSISTLFAGQLASVYEEGGYDYDIRVRGPKGFRMDEQSLRTLPIVTPTGASVPLSAVATVRPSVGPATITRQDQQRMVSVIAAVPGKNLGKVLAELKTKLEAFPWPEGFTYRIAGSAEDFQDSFRWLGLALLASIVLVYMVMASQFESLLHPLIILITIPLAFIGVVVILVATGTPLSVIALIGVLILGGIVVNNAIVLVDYTNQLRDRGMELVAAVLEAGRRRMRPVLMTAGTTILGMLPLALEIGDGSESWSPMARTVIGGLTSSTVLTLVVIPALYTSVESFREKRRARRAARAAQSLASRITEV